MDLWPSHARPIPYICAHICEYVYNYIVYTRNKIIFKKWYKYSSYTPPRGHAKMKDARSLSEHLGVFVKSLMCQEAWLRGLSHGAFCLSVCHVTSDQVSVTICARPPSYLPKEEETSHFLSESHWPWRVTDDFLKTFINYYCGKNFCL